MVGVVTGNLKAWIDGTFHGVRRSIFPLVPEPSHEGLVRGRKAALGAGYGLGPAHDVPLCGSAALRLCARFPFVPRPSMIPEPVGSSSVPQRVHVPVQQAVLSSGVVPKPSRDRGTSGGADLRRNLFPSPARALLRRWITIPPSAGGALADGVDHEVALRWITEWAPPKA